MVKADGAAESSLMPVQTDNVQEFPVELMSCHFVFNVSASVQSVDVVCHFFTGHLNKLKKTNKKKTAKFSFAIAMTFMLFRSHPVLFPPRPTV